MDRALEERGFEVAVLETDRVRFDVTGRDPDGLPGVLAGTVSITAAAVDDSRWRLERRVDGGSRPLFEVHGNRQTAVDAVSNWVRNEWSGVTA